MLLEETTVVAAKLVGASAFGSVIALRFLPGTPKQRVVSFFSSIGIGMLSGGSATEWLNVIPGSWAQTGIAAVAAVFGLAIITNLMQQLPEWIEAARKLLLRS